VSIPEQSVLYTVLSLPALFGLVLIAEGLNTIFKGQLKGVISVILGMIFVTIVILIFLFINDRLKI